MAGEVKSAQITISETWPEHVHCKTVGKAPRWVAATGIVCACGEVLGWPDPEHQETLSQYTKRVASERVDTASAPGRVKGAFGVYGGEQVADPDPTPGPDDGPTPVHPDEEHDGDPGPEEPEVDWGEPPEDEPDPEPLAIEPEEDAPSFAGKTLTGVAPVDADEAQTAPWGASPPPVEPPSWQGVDDRPEHAVGDQVTVAGVEFVKHSESPFPEHNAPTLADAAGQVADDGPPWDAYEDHDGGPKPSNEGIPEEPSVGSAVVPYRGTPIMPGAGQELDPLSGRLAPLDPTLPYTPQDVELKIVEILRQLENSELFLRQQLARLHQATHNHDFRYNLALAKSDQRAADQRKAEAWLATEKERHEMTEADMLVRALRDSQHNLRSQLSGFQSVARSLAVSMVNALDGRERPPLPPEPPRYN
jgi:hypothetical protein